MVALGVVLFGFESSPSDLIAEVTVVTVDTVDPAVVRAQPGPRDLTSYSGLGAWVDVFDYAPAYSGTPPALDHTVVDEMAAAGVRTLFLQAARLDERSPDGLEDPWMLAAFLDAAHRAGIDVIGWYLPEFDDPAADLDRLTAIADFDALGQRFDGVAVDIEYTATAVDHPERSARLVQLSQQLRDHVGGAAVGAIVLPPALTEVVNPDLWPEFPWVEISGLYDAWLPMAYWSFRSGEYGDGSTYVVDSVVRLRANVGRPDAVVHVVGGIGGVDGIDDEPDPEEPLASLDEIERFTAAAAQVGAVGASVYDWRTLEPAARDLLTAAVAQPPP